MQAEDDPIGHKLALPIEEIKYSDQGLMMVTEKGGHLGFIEGFLSLRQWHVKPVLEYLKAIHPFIVSQKQKLD